MPRRILLLSCTAFLFTACIHVKLEPIHVTLDVNVKVEKALGDFFSDLDQKSATILTPAAKP